MITALVDVFVPRDDALDTEDNEMDVADHELEEFKCFSWLLFYEQAAGNHSKLSVRVNLLELTLKEP